MSAHAEVRANQRGITRAVVELLWDFGREIPDRDGAVKLAFDRDAVRRLRRSCPTELWQQIESKLDTYLVVSREGIVVTAARRLRRIAKR